MITTLISFIIVIGIIIFIHELGHFLAAKICGVRVEEFSLGFPPKMISKKIGETEYQLAWVPLGGYVKMSGMLDESFDEEYDPEDPRGFMKQSLIRKVFIITAGVIMNLLLAWVIYSGLTWHQGVGSLSGTTITMVSPDYPAVEAGILPGDRIVNINGKEIADWQEMTEAIRGLAGMPIMISWWREDSLMTAKIIPTPTPELNLSTLDTDTVGKIGVVGTFISEPVGPVKAAYYGAQQVGFIINLSFKSLIAIITRKVSVKEIAGPIGIAKMSGETARSGILTFLGFIAMISSAIAFMNILPIPMLDGGHLGFILIEAVIRRPIPEKFKMNLMRIGFAAIILLLIVVSYNDIIKIFSN
jgi:regulator of sigma E protease